MLVGCCSRSRRAAALNAPNGVEDCRLDGSDSFAFIGTDAKPGAEDLRLPGYPSAARLGSGHRRRIVVSLSQSHRWVRSAVTNRRVKLVFTRIR